MTNHHLHQIRTLRLKIPLEHIRTIYWFSCFHVVLLWGHHLKFQVVQWPCHWSNQTSKTVSFRTFKRKQSKPHFCADHFSTNEQGLTLTHSKVMTGFWGKITLHTVQALKGCKGKGCLVLLGPFSSYVGVVHHSSRFKEGWSVLECLKMTYSVLPQEGGQSPDGYTS
jgi:hypothetical protein